MTPDTELKKNIHKKQYQVDFTFKRKDTLKHIINLLFFCKMEFWMDDEDLELFKPKKNA